MRHRFDFDERSSLSETQPLMFVSMRSYYRPIALLLFVLGLLLMAHPALAQLPTPQPRVGDVPGTAAGCSELLVNGGFEAEGLGWEPLLPGLPPDLGPRYVSAPVYAGTRALQLGLVGVNNTPLTNGISQLVTLPAGADPIVLTLQVWPVHEANPGADLQFVDILDPDTDELLVRVWAQTANSNRWIVQQKPLTALAGRTVRLVIGVSNDGVGGRSALYVDGVSLQACPTDLTPTLTPTSPAVIPTIFLTPTPTPTNSGVIIPTLTPTPVIPTPIIPTATFTPILSPTPLPPGCTTDIMMNGSFEEDIVGSTGWILGDDPVPPRIVAGGFDGLRSLRLGNPPDSGRPNVLSYSSARQLVTIPHTASTATLYWQHWSHTQDNGEPAFGNRVDRQELILLSPELVTLEPPLYRKMLNTGGWVPEQRDLTAYRGKSLYIYFNVLNDGDGLRTWMELDQVQLTLCFPTPTSIIPPPTIISPLVTPSAATQTATPLADLDGAATRPILDVEEATIEPEGGARALEEAAVELVTEEQESAIQRATSTVQRFWWLILIPVVLWIFWIISSQR